MNRRRNELYQRRVDHHCHYCCGPINWVRFPLIFGILVVHTYKGQYVDVAAATTSYVKADQRPRAFFQIRTYRGQYVDDAAATTSYVGKGRRDLEFG